MVEGSGDGQAVEASTEAAVDIAAKEGHPGTAQVADGETKVAAEGEAGEGALDASKSDGQQLPRNPLVMAMLHIKWASFLQKAGQHGRAAEHFANSLALRPSARAHFGLGTCLASLRRRGEAEAALREAIRLSPGLAGAHVNLASVLLARRSFEESAEHCRRALELERGSREAVMNLANVLRNLRRRAEAVDLVWEHIFAEQERLEAKEQEGSSEPSASPPPAPLPAQPALLECRQWQPAFAESGGGSSSSGCGGDAAATAGSRLAVVCVKWGKRYEAAYVNRLCAGVRRRLHDRSFSFICFTDDASGLDEAIEARPLPGNLPLWWGKAYLFSEEAGLDGCRVLFLDLDQVIVGDLRELAAYRGPFALLATDGIACELAGGGYNSSVMAWEASEFFRPIFTKLSPAVLKYVHRFDHWLEMNVKDADLWQAIAPGRVVDYTTAFRGGECIGSGEEEELIAEGAFVAPAEEGGAREAPGDEGRCGRPAPREEEPPEGAAVVTFPRSPKPHEVLEQHEWVRRHWLGEDG